MKKSINFQNIGIVILGYFILNFIVNFIRGLRQRKAVTMQQQSPSGETQPEKTIIEGFKPTDAQDKFFVEDENENP